MSYKKMLCKMPLLTGRIMEDLWFCHMNGPWIGRGVSFHSITFQLCKNGNLYPEIIKLELSKSHTFISALNCKTSTRLELGFLYIGPLQRHRPIPILNPTRMSFTDLVEIEEVRQGAPLCAEGIPRQGNEAILEYDIIL